MGGQKNTLFCTIASDNYTEGLLVFLYSMIRNFKGFNDYPFKIFYNDQISPLSKENQKRIQKLTPQVIFKHIELEGDSADSVYNKRQRYEATYLFFQPFKEAEYDKVFCFDSDMLCVQDFSEILDIPFDGIMGIPEFEPTPESYFFNKTLRRLAHRDILSGTSTQLSSLEKLIGNKMTLSNKLKAPLRKCLDWISGNRFNFRTNPDNPINTGLFLISKNVLNMNLFHELINEAKAFLIKYDQQDCLLGDQPIINLVKHNKKISTTLLSHNLNTQYLTFMSSTKPSLENVRLFHYTGFSKPWIKDIEQKDPTFHRSYPYQKWIEYKNFLLKS